MGTVDKKLYIEGVNSQGFGIIYKALTTDATISIKAKAIYSYIASFAGAAGTAFPSTEKIMKDLGFSHSEYFYKYLKELVDKGFIRINKIRSTNNNYIRNEYVLTVKKDDINVGDSTDDKLLIDGFAAMGYGTVPKKVMLDTNISKESRALYAYFCSYSGAGNSCFPSQSLICKQLKIQKNTLYKYLKELESSNYIKIVKNESDKGQTLSTQYILIEKPVVSATEKHSNNDTIPSNNWGCKNGGTVSKEGYNFGGAVFGGMNFGGNDFVATNNNSINSNSINNNWNDNINKSSSDNIYEGIKEMMISKFNYTCTHKQMYISDVVRDNTGLLDYLKVYNDIIANAPAAADNNLCSAQVGRERALVLAQAISVLYRDKKISLEDIKNLDDIYSRSRESKVVNPKRYIEAIIKSQKEKAIY